MVYKVCKGGVRSGNTLRGLNSLRTKRYAGQGCLVGRSSLPRKQVKCLLEENTEDSRVSEALLNTDVVLSLNKKQRWQLPSAVSHIVRSGRFANTKAVVSVLERHKLRRRANCVGFTCNKQVPGVSNKEGCFLGQRKYFSLNLDYIDEEVSRRQWKKKRAEELMKQVRENKVLRRRDKDRRNDMQTVIVNTRDGPELSKERERILPSQKPEYRLEVFYPCPQSCSLTFNPKYTDVIMTQNDDGEMEVRPNVKSHKKSQKKHRKRFNAKDVKALNTEVECFDEDVDKMWQEAFDDTLELECNGGSMTGGERCEEKGFLNDLVEDGNTFDGSSEEGNTLFSSENILARLVESAQKARTSWISAKPKTRHRRRSGRHSQDNENVSDAAFDTSHIIYTDKNNKTHLEEQPRKKTTTLEESAVFAPKPQLPSATVVLPKSEVDPENLRSRFGRSYAEADCQPRRFILDITEDVTNILLPNRKAVSSVAYTTFIVFTHGGIYDNGFEAFTLTFNCAACSEYDSFEFPATNVVTSIDTIVNNLVGNLLDLKGSGILIASDDSSTYRMDKFATFNNLLMEKMKLEVDTFYTSEELSRASQTGRLQESLTERLADEEDQFIARIEQVADDSSLDIFCEICYENVNPAQSESTPGTQLNACGHNFCNTCWQTHFRTRMREGSVQMTCPGFRCNTQIGVVTLLSLLHVSEVSQILSRERENEMEIEPRAKWCPNPGCGRVIRLQTKSSKTHCTESMESLALDQSLNSNSSTESSDGKFDSSLDVVCACGWTWCFNCQNAAHWPAKCEQAEDYLEKVTTIKPIKETTDEASLPVTPAPIIPPKKKTGPLMMEVEGRLCPKCRRFICKNGGCPHMSCRCGHDFCWKCMAPYREFHKCKPDAAVLYEYTRRVKVKHEIQPPEFNLHEEVKQTPANDTHNTSSRRQRASMYQRALQHRLEGVQTGSWGQTIAELTTKICKSSSKDMDFKRELLALCGVSASHIPQSNLDLALMPLGDYVARYLRSCQRAVRYLQHVIEFSYVLLQDCPGANKQDKERVMRVTSDLVACCSFSQSVLGAGEKCHDVRTAVRRLAEVEVWAGRALDALLKSVSKLRV